MSFKTIAAVSSAVTFLVLAGGPVLAQSMFEQMPTIPDEAPAAQAAPAAPSVAAAPSPSISLGAPPSSVAPAQPIGPQSGADCGAIQKTLTERKNLVAKANSASQSKQKMTPQQACALFGQLQANGNAGIKWITTNKEWCSIPDSFADGFKADNAKVSGIRAKVCSMAAQAGKMEAQARAQAESGGGGGGGLLGGPGLSGSFKLPQGAL